MLELDPVSAVLLAELSMGCDGEEIPEKTDFTVGESPGFSNLWHPQQVWCNPRLFCFLTLQTDVAGNLSWGLYYSGCHTFMIQHLAEFVKCVPTKYSSWLCVNQNTPSV